MDPFSLSSFLETSLPVDADDEDITIIGYKGRLLNIGNGKGIATFIREDVLFEHQQSIVQHCRYQNSQLMTLIPSHCTDHATTVYWKPKKL